MICLINILIHYFIEVNVIVNWLYFSHDNSYLWVYRIITLLLKFCKFLVTETIWSSNKPKDEITTAHASTPTHNEKILQVSSSIKNDPNNFFTFRDGVIDRAVKECAAQFLDIETEGPVHAYFLLTQLVYVVLCFNKIINISILE